MPSTSCFFSSYIWLFALFLDKLLVTHRHFNTQILLVILTLKFWQQIPILIYYAVYFCCRNNLFYLSAKQHLYKFSVVLSFTPSEELNHPGYIFLPRVPVCCLLSCDRFNLSRDLSLTRGFLVPQYRVQYLSDHTADCTVPLCFS